MKRFTLKKKANKKFLCIYNSMMQTKYAQSVSFVYKYNSEGGSYIASK